MRDGYLAVTDGTGGKLPVLLDSPDDPTSIRVYLGHEPITHPAHVAGSDDQMREYALALGWTELNNARDGPAPAGCPGGDAAAGTGAEPDERIAIHIPARMRPMTVTTSVFGRPVRTRVTAGSHAGALMMAARNAALEALTHPYRTVSEQAIEECRLPLHPPILGDRRLCVDPVRSADHEPWTWAVPGQIRVNPEATVLIWNEASADPALRGWWIVLYDEHANPVEGTGGVRDDARAVLVALYDALPAQERDRPDDDSGWMRITALAARRLKKHRGMGDDTDDERRRRRALLEGIGKYLDPEATTPAN